ncbi:hypothetical protein PPTG_19620 [Phytophthora nicotianae INRA-310]|uniref:HAT C-terminal dimerisation domain-containing protein n=1 Tax=Phytophthora nicotianae (strain INRA-310) TaxID=761204 RepID=W2PCN6_PHYN3|nr:hypothetical protein PPTG_19620 [Phytophthora nicotianae INRA-310]ETM98415.1 hypothetical protein PPTG_19620 [Phytophthora nicotianae INRA-310]
MDDGQTASAHLEHMESVLMLYNKDLSMVRFLIGDNCSTNQCLASMLKIPLISCANHRLNLAVNRFLEGYQTQIDMIQNLMIQLRHTNNAAALSRVTHLKPIKANVTRWSSTYQMLQRYMKIRDANLTVSAVEELVPRGKGHRRIAAVADKLVELDSVCVKLQAKERSMAEVRLLFDACMVKYPEMSEYLQPAAQIVHSPLFESAIVKVQNDLPLSSPEQQEIEAFVLPTNESSAAVRHRVDFASTVLRQAKKRRRSEHVVAKYDPILHEVPPTSNACERLFSGCKLVLTSLRASTLPANIEVMMFLRANMELWSNSSRLY